MSTYNITTKKIDIELYTEDGWDFGVGESTVLVNGMELELSYTVANDTREIEFDEESLVQIYNMTSEDDQHELMWELQDELAKHYKKGN